MTLFLVDQALTNEVNRGNEGETVNLFLIVTVDLSLL